VAAGFPTTVAPIIQYGAVPVFVDITIPQYNIEVTALEEALSEKTKAVFLAHTLGNPFDIAAVKAFCAKHKLWLIEDNCDALGSEYTLDGKTGKTGSFGDIATSSFYPPHHITTGEGGAVYTDDPLLHKIVRSLRDWGRDCVCSSGQDNLCGRRFDGQFGDLPFGYDHKYVYSHFGYNLKATDMQAAIGVAQLGKIDYFTTTRRKNFELLKKALSPLEDKLIFPEACENSQPSWFGFMLVCREGSERSTLVRQLEASGIQTRMLFAGNITLQPCFSEMRRTGKGYRIVGELANTDMVMNHGFWLGVYPGIEERAIEYIKEKFVF
jgi:CDP-6-deoxy-D-xylo-4-hexulose-3-dehydrase